MPAAGPGWEEVADQKTGPGKWVVGDVDGNEIATGDGLANFAAAFDDTKCMFGAFRCVGVDEQENVTSLRPKVLKVNWVGKKVPMMKKMGALSGKALYAGMWNGFGAEFDLSSADEFTGLSFAKKILAAGGAHKPTRYDFGGEDQIPLADCYNEGD